jgi:hypothetical protein
MRSRRIIIIVLLVAAAAAAWYFYNQQAAANGTLSLSGTIEATEVNLPTVKGGSVRGVYATEGDKTATSVSSPRSTAPCLNG